jgi:hypothetical protein
MCVDWLNYGVPVLIIVNSTVSAIKLPYSSETVLSRTHSIIFSLMVHARTLTARGKAERWHNIQPKKGRHFFRSVQLRRRQSLCNANVGIFFLLVKRKHVSVWGRSPILHLLSLFMPA